MRAVIKYPHITEKSSMLQGTNNQYTFVVDLNANKIQIRKAVEGLKKGIKVEEVNTQVIRGKVKRTGTIIGKRSNWKKAVVRLKAGQTLDMVESV